MMLVFDHVCVFYGDTPVLRELSFQVRSGEQVGLIGANGAGKSTLMKAALGLLPYTGSITVDGTPVNPRDLEIRLQTLPADEGYWLDTGVFNIL